MSEWVKDLACGMCVVVFVIGVSSLTAAGAQLLKEHHARDAIVAIIQSI